MVTMIKPAQNSVTWASDLTTNWTSIEANLLDRSALGAKGDILAATGAASPVRVPVGTDGQILKADSTQSAGVGWVTSSILSNQDVIDLLWGKKFFSDEGVLPSTKILEYLGTPPALAGTAGTATWTREPGTFHPNGSGIGWYDLGAAKSKILIVVGNLIKLSGSIGVILTASAPTGVDPDGYGVWNDTNGPCIERHSGGVYTRLDAATGLSNIDYRCGFALYYDDGTDTLRMYVRMGSQWFLAGSATDSTFTTLRYVCLQAAVVDQRFVTPIVCYAQ